MDPDITLAQMRTLSEKILKMKCANTADELVLAAMGVELAEAVQALDGWMKADGYPPRDWQ